MSIKLAEFLKEYTEIPESTRDGEIIKIFHSDKMDKMTFMVSFSKLIPSKDIFEFENVVGQVLKVNRMRLMCRYPEELFSMEYFSEMIALLRRDISVINGHLNDAEVNLENDVITIKVVHGGLDMLNKYHFCRNFSQLIYNQFGKKIEVVLSGGEVSSQEYNEMIEKMTSETMEYNNSNNKPAPEKADITIPSEPVDITSLDTEFDKESAEIIFGKPIHKTPEAIIEAVKETGKKHVIVGDVFATEYKELKNDKTVTTFDITDYSGSVKVKIFADKEKSESMNLSRIKKGSTILVSGRLDFDNYVHDIVLMPDSMISVRRIPRTDSYPEKRVELHCHTNMSAMDAVTDPVTLIRRASAWGHPAMAITDHGAVQAFPDCMYNMPDNFKVIYGCEAYIVNDLDKQTILKNPDSRSINDETIIFDVETTGLNFSSDRLTEIGAVKLKNMQVVDTFNTKVNPMKHIPEKITELTGISDDDVKDAPQEKEAIELFMEFCGENPVLVAHNANFDTTFINEACRRNDIDFRYNWIDTLILCQIMLPEIARHKLNYVAKKLKLGKFEHHRASDDAFMLAKIYIELVSRLINDKGV
ncbi:MAG: PHP domain-containing protein, partial [Ruminococcus sp.]|nr:PHP domain-containing protein [Ruminococcus sp.]